MPLNLKKYTSVEELSLYAIFGIGATLINIFAYILFADVIGINYLISNALAWIVAFIFAFVTNKLWVFKSKTWERKQATKEFVEFLAARLFTCGLDMFLMFLLIGVIDFPDVPSKIIVNVIVIIVNYVASKFVVFKKGVTDE